MTELAAKQRTPFLALSLLWIGSAVLPCHGASLVTDNLANPSGGTDTVSGVESLAADFTTDGSAYSLQSATLLLQSDTAGAATLSLYSDDAGIPGSLVGTLAAPASYSSSLGDTTFTASGLTLSPDTTYWLVLGAADDGSYEWSWTGDNTGSGAGFLGDSAYSDGTYWYQTAGVYPYQISVSADPVVASAVPEPRPEFLLAFAVLAGAVCTTRRFWRERAQGVQK